MVDGGAKLANGRIFINCEQEETPDGFRVDVDGNLWCGWGMGPALDGVKVFNPAGKPIGFIALPERAANVCFGGRYRNRLFMAASHSIYSLYVNTQGVSRRVSATRPRETARLANRRLGNIEPDETWLQPGLDSPEQPEAHLAVIARERDHETHPPVA